MKLLQQVLTVRCNATKGLYAPPPGVTDIPGLEVSGIVKQVGKQVTKFKAGDEVCALVPGGGYAEYVVAHQDNVLFIPEGLTLSEGGILLETFMTVWSHLFNMQNSVQTVQF